MKSFSDLPNKLQEMASEELEDDERVEWLDMPKPRFFTPVSTGAFLFAIPWTAFALFWICGAAGFKIPDFQGPESFFCLFGVPFVLIGFCMLSSPIWAYRSSRKTVYVITDRRAITFEGTFNITVRSYTPDKLQSVFRKQKWSGTAGDVIIDYAPWMNSNSENNSPQQGLGFLNIENSKEAERLLKQLAAQYKPAPAASKHANEDY